MTLSPARYRLRRVCRHATVAATLLAGCAMPTARAADTAPDEAEGSPVYVTQEERRHAGVPYLLAPGLTLASFAETEYSVERSAGANDPGHSDDLAASLQLGFEYAPTAFAKAELIVELAADREGTAATVDEAILVFEADTAFEAGAVALALGRLNLPFGEYFSHFVTGPLLEFGETRASAVVLALEADSQLDVATFTYFGRGSDGLAWGLAAAATPVAGLRVGAGYLSALAASQTGLSQGVGDPRPSPVGAVNVTMQARRARFEITAEAVVATAAFRQCADDPARPWAWNLEAAFFPREDVSVALRVEGSDALVDAPSRRAGVALAWRMTERASLAFDYLHGVFRYAEDHAGEDDAGRELKRVTQVAARFSFAF
jgi:hypothetical protein